MYIDFAPPSNSTYNNVSSSRQLANYMVHEDLEWMEKGIYTEGFSNLTDDNIYKSKVIKYIDSNIGQLLKIDAKFYAIHVSPSEKELRVMGSTEQGKTAAMKRYIREVFIPEYAKNFNKELSASDIKFYGKIHFDRSRSDNELNMHCHLIVSRKDQSNKKKLSPLTNHKNTKNGMIKGGFDRVNLFQQAEQGFDKLFNYNRQQTESFNYYNTIENSSVSEQLKLQKFEFQLFERKREINQNNSIESVLSANLENKEASNYTLKIDNHIDTKQRSNTYVNPISYQENNRIPNPLISAIAPATAMPVDHKEAKSRKKKKNRNFKIKS